MTFLCCIVFNVSLSQSCLLPCLRCTGIGQHATLSFPPLHMTLQATSQGSWPVEFVREVSGNPALMYRFGSGTWISINWLAKCPRPWWAVMQGRTWLALLLSLLNLKVVTRDGVGRGGEYSGNLEINCNYKTTGLAAVAGHQSFGERQRKVKLDWSHMKSSVWKRKEFQGKL